MLAAQHRMRSPRDFQFVRRNGKKVLTPGLVMHVCPGMYGSSPTLVGLTVGKDCGNAVERHRASRRIRAALRPVVQRLPQGTGLVVKALPQIHVVNLCPDLITESLLVKVGS
jgi:ribonuclease P protein component